MRQCPKFGDYRFETKKLFAENFLLRPLEHAEKQTSMGLGFRVLAHAGALQRSLVPAPGIYDHPSVLQRHVQALENLVAVARGHVLDVLILAQFIAPSGEPVDGGLAGLLG